MRPGDLSGGEPGRRAATAVPDARPDRTDRTDRTDDPAADALTASFVAGHPDSLRQVYGAYGALVFTFSRRSVGHERAADLTQEVFTDVWRNRRRFDPAQGTLRGWVMGIARHKVWGALRHDDARPTLVPDEDHGAAVAVPADTEHLADRLTLAQALTCLPERTQQLIRLSYLDGLSHTEIAERTGIPLGSVKSDIRRGLGRLRVQLGGRS